MRAECLAPAVPCSGIQSKIPGTSTSCAKHGAIHCTLQPNTGLGADGWAGVYKRCSGGAAGDAVGGGWSNGR